MMSGYETFNNMKPRVSVCSSANVINVQGFIDELSRKCPNFDVQYFDLPYNDIDHFTFEGEDVHIMILCHSINNRRFAITDVMDALYDRFLPNSIKILGKGRICVVAHDFPATKGLDDPDKYKEEMETFQYRQPTAFNTSSLVMMGGKLEGPVELQESNWQQLEEFLERAVRSPIPKSGREQIMETLYTLYGHMWQVVPGLERPTRSPMPKPTRSPMPKPTRSPMPKPTRSPVPKPTRSPMPKPKGSWQLIRENLYKHRRIYCKRVVAFIIGFPVGFMFFYIYHARSHVQSYFAAQIAKFVSRRQILWYSPTEYVDYFLFC